MFAHKFLVIPLLLSAFLCSLRVHATITLSSGTNDYRPIKLSSYKGLPRMGELSSSESVEAVELHNYSIGLSSKLQYMQQFSDCYNNLKGYKVRVEQCQDTFIEHNQQTQFWSQHIEMMAFSMRPKTHQDTFCKNMDSPCAAKSVENIMVKDTTNRGAQYRRPDEFEVRDITDSLMNAHYQNFVNYRKNVSTIKQAWLVTKVNLGNYQFNEESFSFRYNLPSNFFSPFNDTKAYSESGLQRLAFQSRKLQHSARYAPQGTAEEFNRTQYPRSYQVTLAMGRQQAKDLVTGGKNRQLYAVVKLDFFPFALKSQRQHFNSGEWAYKFASPKIEIFSDLQLTQKIAETSLPLENYAQKQDTLDGVVSKPKYQTVKNTKTLDGRIIPLMFLQNNDLKEHYFETMWRNVPVTERKFWQDHIRRKDNIERAKENAASLSSSPTKKDLVSQVKQAEDRANLSVFSWQDKQQMNAQQLQAFYDYILGYGEIKDSQPVWPEILPSVPWGLNLATVFRPGHLQVSQEAMHLVAEGEDKSLIQEFAMDLANSQKIEHLTLTIQLKDLRYQQDTQTFEFNKRSSMHPVTTTDLAPEFIGNNVLYYLRNSESEVGDLANNPKGGCFNNNKRKSQDCAIHWGNVLSLAYTQRLQYLGLNKQINIPSSLDVSSLTSEQAVALVRASAHPGWRVVIELQTPKLRTHNHVETTRGQTKEFVDVLLEAKVNKVSIIDKDDNIWWSESAEQMQGAASYTQIKALQPPAIHQFNSPAQLNPFVEDILLVKFAPEKLTDRTLDAMLSARWSYEKYSENPYAGRFFNVERRAPSYAELAALRIDYKDWLLQLAQQLPSQFTIPLELKYQSDTLKFGNRCFIPEMPKDAPVRNINMAKNAAKQRVRQCESHNRNAQSQVDRCDGYAQDIKKARSELERAQANSCGLAEETVVETEPTVEPKCTLAQPLNMATIAQDMQKCIVETCGTMGADTDMKTYQACMQQTSAYLQTAMSEAMGMGKKPRKPSKPKNTCKPAERKLKQAESRYESKQCEETYATLDLEDCKLAEQFELPSVMPIERIRVSNSGYCSDNKLLYMARDNRDGAQLLPQARPFSDTDLEVHFYPQDLEFSYEAAVTNPNGITNMTSNLVLDVTSRMSIDDEKVLGLKAKVVSQTSEPSN
ncbi:hypothetical protein [Paraglaciecola arctica]|uniref:hypothetical protein n=1 Tax=Paraglaciecola arctica TaxID=1128911 RepID=UPI001C074D47|nr:hypothetical protein [Paraglaciecola arctica]MBU3004501.1 hypothetical protein [Paraglaciecola arctica]